MAELRHEPLDDRWTLYATERAGRPLPPRPDPGPPPPPFDPDCPFCPGNERMLTPILHERPAAVAGDPWATRAVTNKYPILRPDPPPPSAAGHRVLRGTHEVIIETPRHDRDLIDMTPAELRAVVLTYRDRQAALEERWGWATVFRNRSVRAGASLVHPHAQIIAAATPPPPVLARQARAEAYLACHGRPYLDHVIARERDSGERMVLDRDGFVAFVPEAAEVPSEVWIAPAHRPRSSFSELDDADLDAFAGVLSDVLRRLSVRLDGEASYNFVVHSASRAARRAGAAWRWYLRLRPRFGQPGGFEVAADVSINWSLPEGDAARLRDVLRG